MSQIPIPTTDELKVAYLREAQARATELGVKIDASALSDYDIKATCIAGIASGMAQDAFLNFQNLYAQFADQEGINIGLSSAGIPPQFPASPAVLTLTANNLIVDKTYLVPVGTILIAPNGTQYQVIPNSPLNDDNVSISSLYPTLYAISVALGQNTGQEIGVILNISPPIVSTDGSVFFGSAIVNKSIDGSDEETLSQATNRLVEIKQTPLCSNRATDIKYLAIDLSNSVVDAKILIKNQIIYPSPYNCGVFDISGTPINNDILNKGLVNGTSAVVFSRETSNVNISVTQQKLNQQDIVGLFAVASTVQTQGLTNLTNPLTPFFKIVVTLQKQYTLDTQITLDGNVFTLQQLIQREVRKAVCNQPLGATLTQNNVTGAFLSSVLLISSIEQQLDNSLGTGTTTGSLGAYLLDRSIQIYNGSTYEYRTSIILSLGIPASIDGKLAWIYDISLSPSHIYSNISVSI